MSFKVLFFLTNIFTLAVSSKYIPLSFGKCLVPDVQLHFDTVQFFSAPWYEQRSYGNLIFQGDGRCPTLISRIGRDGKIHIQTYVYNTVFSKYLSINGEIPFEYLESDVGFVLATFRGLGFIPVTLPMYIIGTDYDNYAVIYSCQQIGFLKSEMKFVVTRNRLIVSDDVKQKINQTIEKSKIGNNDFVDSVNIGCSPNEPVV